MKNMHPTVEECNYHISQGDGVATRLLPTKPPPRSSQRIGTARPNIGTKPQGCSQAQAPQSLLRLKEYPTPVLRSLIKVNNKLSSSLESWSRDVRSGGGGGSSSRETFFQDRTCSGKVKQTPISTCTQTQTNAYAERHRFHPYHHREPLHGVTTDGRAPSRSIRADSRTFASSVSQTQGVYRFRRRSHDRNAVNARHPNTARIHRSGDMRPDSSPILSPYLDRTRGDENACLSSSASAAAPEVEPTWLEPALPHQSWRKLPCLEQIERALLALRLKSSSPDPAARVSPTESYQTIRTVLQLFGTHLPSYAPLFCALEDTLADLVTHLEQHKHETCEKQEVALWESIQETTITPLIRYAQALRDKNNELTAQIQMLEEKRKEVDRSLQTDLQALRERIQHHQEEWNRQEHEEWVMLHGRAELLTAQNLHLIHNVDDLSRRNEHLEQMSESYHALVLENARLHQQVREFETLCSVSAAELDADSCG